MSTLTDFNPPWLGQSLVRHTFIETGTYRGATLLEAKRHSFARLVSIDVDSSLLVETKALVGFDPRVELVPGSSPEVLSWVIDGSKTTTFWLDAHYTGHSRDWMDAKYGECPLLAELAAIRAARWRVPPIIVIDDAHMFGDAWWASEDEFRTRFDRSQWPTRDEILAALPGYQVTEHVGVLYAVALV